MMFSERDEESRRRYQSLFERRLRTFWLKILPLVRWLLYGSRLAFWYLGCLRQYAFLKKAEMGRRKTEGLERRVFFGRRVLVVPGCAFAA